jgi:uncharacterized UPF0160 family protein
MSEENKKIIVTHSSKFHTDDIFAVATLLLVLEKEGKLAEVIRSRNMEIIKTADYVVDVGEVYDPDRNLFDHHQLGGGGARDNGVPYASFGLVWKKYGEALSGSKELSDKIDKKLGQPVDAPDNGVQVTTSLFKDVYQYELRDITYAFRPTWKEDDDVDKIFMDLVAYAKVLINREIKSLGDGLEAVKKVKEAYDNAKDKRLIILDERYPWEDTLHHFKEPLFVIYPKRIDNTWSLKTVSDDWRSYVSRKDLPESWAGKSGEELEKITGVKDSVFCHNNRFLAVAKTKEAILKLAEIALNS